MAKTIIEIVAEKMLKDGDVENDLKNRILANWNVRRYLFEVYSAGYGDFTIREILNEPPLDVAA